MELRVPIPPVLGLAEIISIKTTGTTEIITNYFYKISLISSYLIAIFLAQKSKSRLIISALVSIVFLYSTIQIHPGNPQLYDVALPFFFLLYVLLLKQATKNDNMSRGKALFLALFSGFCLSMAELSRPFVIYIMPLLIVLGYFKFKENNYYKYQYLFFLTPIILFSGIWHLHLFFNLDQITLSNHSGFNLIRAWNIDQDNIAMLSENPPPIEGGGGGRNINTAIHNENSKTLQKAVLEYWVNHPKTTFFRMLERVNDLLSAKTRIYGHKPTSKIFSLYKLIVQITSSILIVSFIQLTIQAFKYSSLKPLIQSLTRPDTLIILFALYCLLILSIGDAGEEARFLITILPLLATIPIFTTENK